MFRLDCHRQGGENILASDCFVGWMTETISNNGKREDLKMVQSESVNSYY
jgi:hypothetical protein